MTRHIIRMKLYILMSCSIIFSSENINIPLDPIYHNNFYLNSINPEYQIDFIDRDYFIDGGLGFPISVYDIKDLYTDLNDSTRTNSCLLYKQGDVGYRDLYIDIKTKVESLGVLKLIANGRNYPGKYIQYSAENILQNYLLHFSKKYDNSKVSFYKGYHLENTSLNYINAHSGESHFSGLDYIFLNDKYEFSFKYAFQLGQLNYNSLTDYSITRSSIDSKYYLTEKINTYIHNTYKDFYYDGSSYYLNEFSFGFVFHRDMTNINIGFNYPLSNLETSPNFLSIFPKLTLRTKFDYLNIAFGVSSNYWTNPGTYNVYRNNELNTGYQLNGYGYSFLSLSYKINNISIQIEPRTVFENNFTNQYFSLNNNFEIDFNIFNSSLQIIPYLFSINKTNVLFLINSNHYRSSDLIVKNHILSSLKLFEIDGDKRYKKFIGVQYTGIQFNNLYYINLDELSILSMYPNGNNFSWNDGELKNYLDLYVGIEFDKFIFSWHFTNVLSENYIINIDGHIQNFNMKYFSVKWKFDD